MKCELGRIGEFSHLRNHRELTINLDPQVSNMLLPTDWLIVDSQRWGCSSKWAKQDGLSLGDI